MKDPLPSIPTAAFCILSLDLGTTHIKAFAYSTDGKVLGSFKRTLANDQGLQQPEQVLSETLAVLKELSGHLLHSGYTPAGLCISGAMHSILPVNRQGKALAQAMLWSNNSGEEIAASLKGTLKARILYQRTGTPVHPMSPFIKLNWLKKQDPALFKAAYKFISIKEYVYYHLTGLFNIDYSMASCTGLLDSVNLCWSEPALEYTGIGPSRLGLPVSPYLQQSFLPSVLPQLGFTREFPVIIGASDGCLACLGAAPLTEGNISLGLGTSAALRTPVSLFTVDEHQRTFTYLLDESHFISGGPSNNAGAVYTWLLTLFSKGGTEGADFEKMNSLAAGIEPGANGLCFMPYIFGERAPLWDPGATGSFTGIRAMHTQAHFARAVMEGILYNVRYILEILEEKVTIQQLFPAGGLCNFPVWRAALTNILNRDLHFSEGKEDSAAGAAIMGLASLKIIPSISRQTIFYNEQIPQSCDQVQAAAYGLLYDDFRRKLKDLH